MVLVGERFRPPLAGHRLRFRIALALQPQPPASSRRALGAVPMLIDIGGMFAAVTFGSHSEGAVGDLRTMTAIQYVAVTSSCCPAVAFEPG